MKLNNPFDRLKKHENIPISLFPADKTHSTSLKIGRATPLYVAEMIQGNRIKLDVDQLTRFAALQVPVMNNYKVSYGAFFVPYVALDGFFTSEWMKKYLGTSPNNAKLKYCLDARHFFNPASDNANRVFPEFARLSIMGGHKLESSILDHLGYYIGTDFENSGTQLYGMSGYFTQNSSGNVVFTQTTTNIQLRPSEILNNLGFLYEDDTFSFNTANDSNYSYSSSKIIVPFDAWVIGKYILNLPLLGWSTSSDMTNLHNDIQSHSISAKAERTLLKYFKGENYRAEWEDVFGKRTMTSLLDAYTAYVNNLIIMELKGTFTANSIRYLAYMRIYADWFLNENFTKHDDFLDLIGNAYLNYAKNAHDSVPSYLTFDTLFSSGGASSNGNYKLQTNPELNFFAEYLRKGELLPVLWEKDRWTDARYQKVMAELGTTPVGSTVEENFFNRQLARFKDLISRMGYDYRDNTAALYGSKVSDATLQRSQVVGFREFSVTIGDVAQTAPNTADSQLGQFAGVGVSRDNTGGWDWTAEENGLFIVMCWVRPSHVCNAKALPRDILKSSYYDYLIPELGGVGYQDILLDEYCPDVGAGHRSSRFGYEEKYREYMSINNEVHGNMRTSNKHYRSDRFPTFQNTLQAKDVKELYITDDDDFMKVFQDTNPDYDPLIATMRFTGTVTRQLPSTIRTDF